MATAPQPGSPGVDHTDTVVISLAILGILIVIIIVVVRYMNRMRPPVVSPASVQYQRRREEERYQKEIRSSLLESLHVIRYSMRLPPNEQSDSKVHYYARNSYPPRRQLQSTASGEKPGAVHAEAVAIARANECKAETMVNNPGTPDDKIRMPLEEDALRNGDQSGSRDEPASCSVCTEDFAESEKVRILPCGHIYHQRCIDPWLLDFRSTCPLWLALPRITKSSRAR
ncbi:hypothetical protein V495_00560 [Pseudogymnoascus sp. VKM F-4514 (FW-929)]|nr:hypothetical protein V495_00560 [Pseudogymnoascus sp. VKM F-4514 (FW-929)]KFY67646.1 hypothetical protein V497_00268 [Pseudogymnoascus sp. VKM F-4516 (FW-969)]